MAVRPALEAPLLPGDQMVLAHQAGGTMPPDLMALEFLNETLFRNLAHARELMAAWVTDYNSARPHSAFGYQTPAGFNLHLTPQSRRSA